MTLDPNSPSLADLRRRAEILDLFDDAQQYAEDSLPLRPSARQIEAISPDWAAVAHASRLRETAGMPLWSRCPVCKHKFKQRGGGRIRIFCNTACRVRAFRNRAAVRAFVEDVTKVGSQ